MTTDIVHDHQSHEFIKMVEGKEAVLHYNISSDGKTLDYYSTFVPPELRGRHLGQDIVKFALEYAKDHHLNVIPSCPFVKKYIEGHQEYQDLVAPSH